MRKVKIKILFLLFVLSLLFAKKSSAKSWLWNTVIESSYGIVTPLVMETDGDYMYSSIIFNDNLTINGSNYTTNGDYDILIVKQNNRGDIIWVKQFGSTGKDIARGIAISENEIYLTGGFENTITFDSYNLTNYDGIDVFITCLNADGTVKWAKRTGYGKGINYGFGIDVSLNRIAITCSMSDKIMFRDVLKGTTDTLGRIGYGGIVIATFDDNGNYIGAKDFITNYNTPCFFKIKVVNNSIYTGGYYRDSLWFNDTCIVSNYHLQDVFLIKTDMDLNQSWFYTGGGIKNEYAFSMDVDTLGNSYLTGSFWSKFSIPSDTITPVGLSDMLLMKIDSNGSPVWIKNFGDANRQALYEVYAGDQLYVSGEFTGSMSFGSSNISTYNSNNHQPFIGVLDYNGNPVSALQLKSSNGVSFNNANSISMLSNGALIVSGFFNSDSLFIGSDFIIKDPGSMRNGFIAKYGCPDTIALSSTPVTCVDGSGIPISNDGTATVSYIEGGPYNYLWSTGDTTQTIENLDEGMFYVTVSDNSGCSISGSVLVSTLNTLSASITNTKNVSCSGWNDGSATVTPVDGKPPYSYLWSNGDTDSTATNLSVGFYTVTVLDQCVNQAVVSVNIVENSLLVTGESTCTPKKQCIGTATVYVSGGTPPYTYIWNNGGDTQTITNLCKGVYKVTVIDALGCQQDKDNINVKFCNPNQTTAKSYEYNTTIYPNPATNVVKLSSNYGFADGTTIKILNQIGNVVYYNTVSEDSYGELEISVERFLPGIYYIQIIRDTMIEIKRVVVQ